MILKVGSKYLPKMQVQNKKMAVDTETESNEDARRCA